MKKILFVFFISFLGYSSLMAQKSDVTKPDMPIDPDTKIVTYKGVGELSGTTKSELYKRALIFFKTYYKAASANTIQVMDSVNGKVEAKASFFTYKTLKNGVKAQADMVRYTFTVDIKDGKYRYTITNVNIAAASYKPIETYFSDTDPNKDVNWGTLQQADDYFTKTIGFLREGMEQPSSKVKKDDW